MIKSVEELIIYESPDGGKTVYSRKGGSSSRELVKMNPEDRITNRWLKLKEAIILAQDDPSLDDAIKTVEILLELKK
jgi:hypothetical protein